LKRWRRPCKINPEGSEARHNAGLRETKKLENNLKFLVEIAHRARDVDSAGDAALAVLDALDDTRRLAALGTVSRLRRVHHLLAITSFGNFGHLLGVSPSLGVSLHTSAAADGFNVAVIGQIFAIDVRQKPSETR
jgi:hypothetical protein